MHFRKNNNNFCSKSCWIVCVNQNASDLLTHEKLQKLKKKAGNGPRRRPAQGLKNPFRRFAETLWWKFYQPFNFRKYANGKQQNIFLSLKKNFIMPKRSFKLANVFFEAGNIHESEESTF